MLACSSSSDACITPDHNRVSSPQPFSSTSPSRPGKWLPPPRTSPCLFTSRLCDFERRRGRSASLPTTSSAGCFSSRCRTCIKPSQQAPGGEADAAGCSPSSPSYSPSSRTSPRANEGSIGCGHRSLVSEKGSRSQVPSDGGLG